MMFATFFMQKVNCRDKLSPEKQEQIFNQFWALGNFNLRIAYVAGLITIQNKKSTSHIKSTKAPRNRLYSYCYYVDTQNVYVYVENVYVCQKCFKSTLDETDRFIRTVISKKLESPGTVTKQDLRGKSTPPNKYSAEKISAVLDHINSFPAYQSHYTRKVSTIKYLQADLNISTMYRLYTEQTTESVSLSKYSETFKSLNLKFKKPKVDTIKLKIG